jgi:adenine/guanine phosphoribosyltransferase-like PRPP-binding protein
MNNIKLEYDYNNGKVIKAVLNSDNNKWGISIESNFAVMKKQSDNPTAGKVIEKYRELLRDDLENANTYFKTNKNVIDDFIQQLPNNSNNKYDYVQIFLPRDKNIQELLTKFAEKQFDGFNNYSKYYYKKEDVSVVGMKYEKATHLFNFDIPKNVETPLKSILIIDDVVDTGCTIKIFISNLIEANMISDQTKIKVLIIYNNFKQNEYNSEYIRKLLSVKHSLRQ